MSRLHMPKRSQMSVREAIQHVNPNSAQSPAVPRRLGFEDTRTPRNSRSQQRAEPSTPKYTAEDNEFFGWLEEKQLTQMFPTKLIPSVILVMRKFAQEVQIQMEELVQENEQRKEWIIGAEEKLKQTTQYSNRLEAAARELNDELSRAKQEIAEMKIRLADSANTNELNDVRQMDLKNMETKLQQMSHQKNEQDSANRSLEAQIRTYEEKMERAINQIASQKNRAQQSQQEIDLKNTEIQQLHTALRELQGENRSLLQAMEENLKQTDSLAKCNDELNHQLQELETRLRQLDEQSAGTISPDNNDENAPPSNFKSSLHTPSSNKFARRAQRTPRIDDMTLAMQLEAQSPTRADPFQHEASAIPLCGDTHESFTESGMGAIFFDCDPEFSPSKQRKRTNVKSILDAVAKLENKIDELKKLPAESHRSSTGDYERSVLRALDEMSKKNSTLSSENLRSIEVVFENILAKHLDRPKPLVELSKNTLPRATSTGVANFNDLTFANAENVRPTLTIPTFSPAPKKGVSRSDVDEASMEKTGVFKDVDWRMLEENIQQLLSTMSERNQESSHGREANQVVQKTELIEILRSHHPYGEVAKRQESLHQVVVEMRQFLNTNLHLNSLCQKLMQIEKYVHGIDKKTSNVHGDIQSSLAAFREIFEEQMKTTTSRMADSFERLRSTQIDRALPSRSRSPSVFSGSQMDSAGLSPILKTGVRSGNVQDSRDLNEEHVISRVGVVLMSYMASISPRFMTPLNAFATDALSVFATDPFIFLRPWKLCGEIQLLCNRQKESIRNSLTECVRDVMIRVARDLIKENHRVDSLQDHFSNLCCDFRRFSRRDDKDLAMSLQMVSFRQYSLHLALATFAIFIMGLIVSPAFFGSFCDTSHAFV